MNCFKTSDEENMQGTYKRFTSTRKKTEKNKREISKDLIPNEVEPPKEPLKEPLREPEPLGEPLDGENIPLEEIETSRFETSRFETSRFETSQFEKSTLKRKRSPVKSIENTIANKRERESSIPSKKSNASSLDTSTSTNSSYKLCCCGLATVLKYNFLLLTFKLVHILFCTISSHIILGWYHDNLGWKYCYLFTEKKKMFWTNKKFVYLLFYKQIIMTSAQIKVWNHGTK